MKVKIFNGRQEIEITKEQFKDYVQVQKSGVTNMFDIKTVCDLTNLSKQEAFAIMENYSLLKKEFII